MVRIACLSALLCATLPGCGKDCEDVAGTWTITRHCEPSFVGQEVDVTQTDCDVGVKGSFGAFSGKLSGSDLSVTGKPADTVITCTGTASSSVITMACNPTCAVRLEK